VTNYLFPEQVYISSGKDLAFPPFEFDFPLMEKSQETLVLSLNFLLMWNFQ